MEDKNKPQITAPITYRSPVPGNSHFSIYNLEISEEEEIVNEDEGEDVIFEQWGAAANNQGRPKNSFTAPNFMKLLREDSQTQSDTSTKLGLRNSNDEWFGSSIWGGKSKGLLSPVVLPGEDSIKSSSWFQGQMPEQKGRESWEIDMERKIIENLGIDFDLDDPFVNSDRVQVHSSADLDQRAKSLPKLLEMGFLPSLCIQALENFEGDVNGARSWLIASRMNDNDGVSDRESLSNDADLHWSSSWGVDVEDKEDILQSEQDNKSWQEWEQKHRSMLESNVHIKTDKSLPVSAVPCKFYLSGFCKNGDKCPFLHEEKGCWTETEDKPKKSIPAQCKFFASGTCRKGDKCPFVHEHDKSAATPWPVNYKVTYIDGKTKKKIDQNGKKETSVVELADKLKGVTIITRPRSLSSGLEEVKIKETRGRLESEAGIEEKYKQVGKSIDDKVSPEKPLQDKIQERSAEEKALQEKLQQEEEIKKIRKEEQNRKKKEEKDRKEKEAKTEKERKEKMEQEMKERMDKERKEKEEKTLKEREEARREKEKRDKEEREKKLQRELEEKERREKKEKEEREKKIHREKEEKERKERKEKEKREREERERNEREEREKKKKEEQERKQQDLEKKRQKDKEERDRLLKEKTENDMKENLRRLQQETEAREKEERQRKERERLVKEEREAQSKIKPEEVLIQEGMPELVSDDEEESIPDLVSDDDDDVPDLVSDDEEVPDLVSEGEDEKLEDRDKKSKDTWMHRLKLLTSWYSPEYTIEQKEQVTRIKNSSDHYQVLNIDRDTDASSIKQQYHRLVLKLHPDRNSAPGAEDAFRAVTLAYQVLSDSKERLTYDALLKKGEGKIDTKIKDTPDEPVKSGIGWGLLRLLFIVVGLIFLLVLLVFKLFKGALGAVRNLFKFKPKKQMKWCDSCREYHVVSNDEGEVWEENGRYFYRRDGTVHDVTDFVQGGFFTTQHELDDEEGEEDSYGRNYSKGRKSKKKKLKVKRR